MLHLYTGDGQGKTCAAVGLCVRARGAGLRVLFAQLLKGRPTGETDPLARLGVTVLREAPSEKFLFQMDGEERAAYCRAQRESFAAVCRRLRAGEFDLAVLDEALDAAACGVLPEEELLALADACSGAVELVLTGREASPALCARADYHTELRAVRHPFAKGVPARRGVEF